MFSFQTWEIEAWKIKINQCLRLASLASVWWTTSSMFQGLITFSGFSWPFKQSLNISPSFSRSFMIWLQVTFSNSKNHHSSPQTPLSVTMNFFQSLNTLCLFFAPRIVLTLFCTWNTLEHTFTALLYDLDSSCWPFRSELSITPSRKPPLTPKHLAGHTLLDSQPITVLHTTGL